MSCEGITISDHCWLGSGVKILDGVTIGQSSVIGTAAVVTKNIFKNSVAIGIPAKVIQHKSESNSVFSVFCFEYFKAKDRKRLSTYFIVTKVSHKSESRK
ncbi:MAG: hypothetical protein AB4042_04480 [Leptolyngbyaceae cyanobacterium]